MLVGAATDGPSSNNQTRHHTIPAKNPLASGVQETCDGGALGPGDKKLSRAPALLRVKNDGMAGAGGH